MLEMLQYSYSPCLVRLSLVNQAFQMNAIKINSRKDSRNGMLPGYMRIALT